MESLSTYFEKRAGYIYMGYKGTAIIDLEEAKLMSEIYIELCAGEVYPTLMDGLNTNAKISHDARDYFANYQPLVDSRNAQAFVLNNIGNILLFKFYLKFHTPENPVKLFSNIKDAENWLKQFAPKK